MTGTLARWLLLVAVLGVLTSCTAKNEALTALVVVVDSDITDLDSVTVDVGNFGKQRPVVADLADGGAGLPKWLGVVHRGGPLGPITVTAKGFKNGDVLVIERQARVSFVANKVMMLRLVLSKNCLDLYVSCQAKGQTCTEQKCQSIDIGQLSEWTAKIPPLMVDVSIDAGPASEEAGARDSGVPDAGSDAAMPPADAGQPICEAHTGNCDKNDGNGCESNLLTSTKNCGACGKACVAAGTMNVQSSACANGSCQITCNNVDHGDCDGKASTGCETDLKSSAAHCGACNHACTVQNGSAACSAGACVIAGCSAGFADCNGGLDCERDTKALGPCLPDTGCTLVQYNGHDYYFCPMARSYDDARAQCQVQTFGDLVRVDDDAENSFVRDSLASRSLAGDPWIGASDSASEGAWRWSDDTVQFWSGGSAGSAVNGQFSKWNTGEPSTTSGNEDCAQLTASAALWDARDCSASAPFVCEIQTDACPDDPAKQTPMQCGCGVVDTDTDQDGTADCVDACPNDPNKVAPGMCDCGTADTDTDGDHTADCVDACSNDPNKVAPGMCDCGTADIDTDNDGTADCKDACLNDPNKIAQGVCGCGIPDTDTDNDGTADCKDACPNDATKSTDVDTDGDLAPDCVDSCKYDPTQTQLPCTYSFTPSNFDPTGLFATAGNVSCSSVGTTTFDTSTSTARTVCGTMITPVIKTQSGGPALWILPMNSLSVASGVTLRFTGTRPVVIAVANDAAISGTIDVSAQQGATTTTPGAGGNVSCAAGTGQGGDGVYNASTSRGDGAGGGGGFGTAGGAGGAGDNGGAGGAAGVVSTNTTLVPLRGGCRGGATATGGNTTGAGAGGGAVEIVVGGKLTLGASAIIAAAGAGGLKGANAQDAGGGGGSGGAVFLEAKLLSIDSGAWLSANGGGGAGGNATSSVIGTSGASGAASSTSQASGGSGGNTSNNDSDGGGGGLGAAAALAATGGTGGTAPGCFALICGSNGGGGGGGGGGAGRIRIHGTTAGCSVTAHASPAATVTCP